MGPKKTGPNRTARKPPARLSADELFEYAVKYLALQACSTEGLRTKLRLKAASAGDIDSAIARLHDIGYLNDARFAESYAANRVENDGFGRMRVLSDLRAKRVPAKLADQAVEQAFGEKSEREMIDAFIERRMPSLASGGRGESDRENSGREDKRIEDEKELARAYRRLRRAGFSSGGILTALKRVAARPELIEEPPPDEGDLENLE